MKIISGRLISIFVFTCTVIPACSDDTAPGNDTSGNDTVLADTASDSLQPDLGTPDTETPDADTPDVNEPDADEPDVAGPEIVEPGSVCAALPRQSVRFSRDLETTGGADCGFWALTIAPDGMGNRFTLARATRGAGLGSTDDVVVLSGPIDTTECMNDVLLRKAVFDASGTGPSPFLATSVVAEYSLVSAISSVAVTIDTNLASGPASCSGTLTKEP